MSWLLVLTLAVLASSVIPPARGGRTACDDDDDAAQLEFDDVPSLTVLSSAVFDGRPTAAVHSDDEDVVTFRVGQFYKGVEQFPVHEGQAERSQRRHVAVRVSSSRCASALRRRRRRRLLVFLNGSSHKDSAADDDDSLGPVYWSTAAPVRFSKRSVRAARQHSCSDCGAYTTFIALHNSRVLTSFSHTRRRHGSKDGRLQQLNATVAECRW